MNTKHIRVLETICAAVMTALGAGCASMSSLAVSSDAVEQSTATALGLPRGQFTISGRVDDGFTSNYSVTTSTGAQFSCYVTGSVSFTGRQVSDAMCTAVPKTAKAGPGTKASKPVTAAAPVTPSAMPCNALLKAAGRCS